MSMVKTPVSDGAASPSRTGKASPDTKPLSMQVHWLDSLWHIAAQETSSSVVCILADGPPLGGVAGKRSNNTSSPLRSPAGLTSDGALEQIGWRSVAGPRLTSTVLGSAGESGYAYRRPCPLT
jgi:hypothetical protein